MHATTPKAPEFLKLGDTIAIVSPSSHPTGAHIDSAVSVLTRWGFTPIVAPNAHAEYRTFGGTTEQRLSDLLWALRKPGVKAIFSSRGGYGSANVLTQLPLDTLRRYPKWFIGYSDITGYLSAEVRAGNMGIHANMAGRFLKTGGNDTISQTLRNLLLGRLPQYNFPAHPYNHTGVAEGILLGGNMSVFNDLSGTEYDMLDTAFTNGKPIILFIEDVEEPIAKIDRMLMHLKLRGILNRVQAVIVGRFADCPPSRGYEDVNQMLHEYLDSYQIPICYDFPTGHDEAWNYPLIVGSYVRLNVLRDRVLLNFYPNKRNLPCCM